MLTKVNYHKALLALLFIPLFSFAAEIPNYSVFEGTYVGTVLNEGVYSPIVSTLVVKPDGRLTGEYSVEIGRETFKGTLSNPRITDAYTLSFEWTDKHGEGYEVLEFSGDYKSFIGYWGNRDSPSQSHLSGKR